MNQQSAHQQKYFIYKHIHMTLKRYPVPQLTWCWQSQQFHIDIWTGLTGLVNKAEGEKKNNVPTT
jgi:hypothetical protein